MTRVRLLLTSLAVLALTVSGITYSTFARWASTSVTFYVNPANADISGSAAVSALQFAMDVWNREGGSPFRYVYGGTVSDTSNAYDNRNVVIFRNVSNGSTIATTYSWWDSSNRLLDSDIVVWDGGFTFFTGTSGCGGVSNGAYLEDIATHEFGHALGLSHSASTDATMYPSYSYCSQEFRTLASDDIAAIRSLYGTGGGGGGGGSNTAPTVVITSPANGATYSQGTSITLAASASDSQDGNLSASVQWTDNGVGVGTGASLQVTPTGSGAHTYTARVTDSGNLQASSQVSVTVTTVTGGGTSAPVMSSPAPGSTLAGSSQTFTWTAGNGVSAYWLSGGNTVGGGNLFDLSLGSNRTATVTGLPTGGGTIYVRLWWLAGSWGYTDYTYTAANTGGGGGGTGGGGTSPVITAPSSGATLSGSTQTFTWTAGTATSFWLYLGRSGGANDLLNQNMGSSLGTTVSGLPTDGGRIYARLWWLRNGAWEYADTSYTAASTGGTGGSGSANPAILTPAAGSTLSGSWQTFSWTAGSGATSYWLYLGRTAGANDLFDRDVGWSLSTSAGGLPTDGRTIYARLWWLRNGAWEYADTTYRTGP